MYRYKSDIYIYIDNGRIFIITPSAPYIGSHRYSVINSYFKQFNILLFYFLGKSIAGPFMAYTVNQRVQTLTQKKMRILSIISQHLKLRVIVLYDSQMNISRVI